MTVAEVYSATARLGFESEIESGYDVFLPALNRAVRQVNELRPRVRCLPVRYTAPTFSKSYVEEMTVDVSGNLFVGDVFGNVTFTLGNVKTEKDGRVYHNSEFDSFKIDGVARNVEVYNGDPAMLDMSKRVTDFDGFCGGYKTNGDSIVDITELTEVYKNGV